MQNIKFSKSIKDYKNKEKSEYKRSTKEGVENWKAHVKSNPEDYNRIDDFLGNDKFDKKSNIFSKLKRKNNKEPRKKGFSRNGSGNDYNDFGGFKGRGENSHNSRGDREFTKKPFGGKDKTRPGKVRRMMMRNKKNSFNGGGKGNKR